MEIENIGEIADLARVFAYEDWEYYQAVKADPQRLVVLNCFIRSKRWLELCQAVEKYFGPPPKDWREIWKSE